MDEKTYKVLFYLVEQIKVLKLFRCVTYWGYTEPKELKLHEKINVFVTIPYNGDIEEFKHQLISIVTIISNNQRLSYGLEDYWDWENTEHLSHIPQDDEMGFVNNSVLDSIYIDDAKETKDGGYEVRIGLYKSMF